MTNIHASCVTLANAGRAFGANPRDGVLLLGDSGAGKSDLALRLIAQGATLVADDRIELFVRDDALWVRAPAKLAGLIEVRGLGIVALPHAAEARVALVIRLVAPNSVPRLPPAERYEPPDPLIISAGARPPVLSLAAFDASAPAKVALAAAAFAGALFRQESNPE